MESKKEEEETPPYFKHSMRAAILATTKKKEEPLVLKGVNSSWLSKPRPGGAGAPPSDSQLLLESALQPPPPLPSNHKHSSHFKPKNLTSPLKYPPKQSNDEGGVKKKNREKVSVSLTHSVAEQDLPPLPHQGDPQRRRSLTPPSSPGVWLPSIWLACTRVSRPASERMRHSFALSSWQGHRVLRSWS